MRAGGALGAAGGREAYKAVGSMIMMGTTLCKSGDNTVLKWGHNCVELGTQLCPWKTGDFLVSKWGHNCVGGPKPGSSPFQHRKIPFPYATCPLS